jgi:L-amino acid N-acyltransferase YncA/GNAT superfamily N-acetyltransferase
MSTHTDSTETPLSDGKTLATRLLTYPVPRADQAVLIDLWRSEWSRANNCDWLAAMGGDYSDSLTIQAVIGSIDGEPVGTASVHYAVEEPEVAIVGSVLTHRDHRGLSIATHLTGLVTQRAFAAGCRVAYLGTSPRPDSMYMRCGYAFHNGGVMRCAVPGAADNDDVLFAPGQKTSIRPALWGDLPAMACFYAQPVATVLTDYPRGYLSGRHAPLGLCASVFPRVHDHVVRHGGALMMLVGDTAHRVLGFGSITPGPAPARHHKAVIDVATHDHYTDRLDDLVARLIAEAQRLEVRVLQAHVAESDETKRDCFVRAGFETLARLKQELRVGDKVIDVDLLERPVM